MLRPKKLSQSGFTGIELLIVLTIVAIVALLVANNIQEAVAKGRDIERRSDIDAVQDALEQYWHSAEHYPTDLTALNLGIDVLTDPSGKPIMIAAPSGSNNRPSSGYIADAQPEQEYTYTPYQCSGESSQTPAPADSETSDETGSESEENTDQVTVAAEPAIEVCQKYVLYSWLEKGEIIPYEKSNFHNLN